MIQINTTYLFLIVVFTTVISCTTQVNKDSNTIQKPIVANGRLIPTLDDKIWAIHQDKKGNYWFGSNGNGVYVYNGQNLKVYTEEDGLLTNTIRGIQEDEFGNIFIETPDGVSKFDGQSFVTLPIVFDASNKWKLETTDLWFNCNGNPDDVYRYDGNKLFELKLPRQDLNKAFKTVVTGLSFPDMNESPYSVFGIDKDIKGNLWIGTITAGAFRYDGTAFLWVGEQELTTLPDGRVPGVRSMLEDKDGNIWLSNFKSKYRVVENEKTTYEKLESGVMSNPLLADRLPYFNSGLRDKKGNLWMTTYGGGVWKYDGKKLFNFPLKNKDKEEVLSVTIYEDNKGVIWVGSDNSSAYKFDGNNFVKFDVTSNQSQ